MLVRVEEIRDTDVVLVIDEVDNFLGKVYFSDFVSCIDDSRSEVIEDDYTYWFVDKVHLEKLLVR